MNEAFSKDDEDEPEVVQEDDMEDKSHIQRFQVWQESSDHNCITRRLFLYRIYRPQNFFPNHIASKLEWCKFILSVQTFIIHYKLYLNRILGNEDC